tara:strand:- start:496 stop:909 length:414 start_codon:yes stop_codon:yes gene_type:complete
MYVTEAMIQSMEEMMRNASDMEKSIKMMMESEGRMHGIELDRRKNARDMWAELSDAMANASTNSSMMTEWHDPMMHTHDDGMEHSHEGGDVQHTHDDPYDGAPSSMEPAPPAEVGGYVEQEDGSMKWQEEPADKPEN